MASPTDLIAQDSSWKQRSELKALVGLSPPLEKEMDRLDREFWVSSGKLKEIAQRFQEGLEQGMNKHTFLRVDGKAKRKRDGPLT